MYHSALMASRKPALTAGSKAAPTPEHRQVSVMFCDLVDSVRWTRSLDPEDWLRVLRNYLLEVNMEKGRLKSTWTNDAVFVA